ncbi:hypothetical protein GW765_03990 [Candidatus Parcubacteria bacterium]|nr:hypothetical protein [Candidatus Parcubacteria bacterium]
MEILGKLFSSDALVKLMRLFLMQKEEAFDLDDIVEKSRIKLASAKLEIKLLEDVGFIKKKVFIKDIIKPAKVSASKSRQRVKDKDPQIVKKKCKGWMIDDRFAYIRPLQALLIETETLEREDLASKFKNVGKIKLLLAAGVFIQDEESRIDLLIVGDDLKKKTIEDIVSRIESEMGTELDYAIFSTEDFKYRVDMYDKLVCDILEFPHEKVIVSPGFNLEMGDRKS